MSPFDVAYVRSQFPALRRMVDGQPAAYLDGPGGTQTPQRVLDAVVDYLANHNCNIHGAFVTSEETDAVVQAAHEAGADLVGCHWEEVSYGANMTTLGFLLSDAIARDIRPGDEVLITQLDHEANRGPWQRLAERGAVIREAPVDLETCSLDWSAFEKLVEPGKTKVVAVGYASNAVGTVNDVARAAALAREAGIALAVLPGDGQPDAELMAHSTLPDADCLAFWHYLVEGGPRNAARFLDYAAHLLGAGEAPPAAVPLLKAGLYWPGKAETELREFENLVLSWQLVREAYMLSGESDYMLKCVAPELTTFQEFVLTVLTAAPNVSHVKSMLAIRASKYKFGVPVDVDAPA